MSNRRRPARAVTILAGVATAGALAAALATPAAAATGVLRLNGADHVDPHGCHRLAPGPDQVANRTDETVFLLSGRDCTGDVLGVLLPGEAAADAAGAGSVFAP